MKTWTRSSVVIAIMLTIFKPTTAGANSEVCKMTHCKRNPQCPNGFDTKWKTNRDCRTHQSKKYCCPPDLPQCIVTECDTKPSCPRHYRALESTKNGCVADTAKLYCCKRIDLPICFAMDCTDKRVANNTSCPRHYTEKGRYMSECGAHGAERVACCTTGFNNWKDGNQTFRISNTQSSHVEYFTIFFNNSQSLYAQFFKILLIFPILISLFKCSTLE